MIISRLSLHFSSYIKHSTWLQWLLKITLCYILNIVKIGKIFNLILIFTHFYNILF